MLTTTPGKPDLMGRDEVIADIVRGLGKIAE